MRTIIIKIYKQRQTLFYLGYKLIVYIFKEIKYQK